MKLEEAIENRTAYLKNGRIPKSTKDYNATLLSIEALIAWRQYRSKKAPAQAYLLPGETEE